MDMSQPPAVRLTRRLTFAAGHILARPEWDESRNREVFGACLIHDVDHRNLNRDVPWLMGCLPTPENVAMAIWSRLEGKLSSARLEKIRLKETENNVVEVERR